MYITIIFIVRSNLSSPGSHLSMTPSPTATYSGFISICASHRFSSKEISTVMLSFCPVKLTKPSSLLAFLQPIIVIFVQILLSISFGELHCRGKYRIVLTILLFRVFSLFTTTLFPFFKASILPALLNAGATFFLLQDPSGRTGKHFDTPLLSLGLSRRLIYALG